MRMNLKIRLPAEQGGSKCAAVAVNGMAVNSNVFPIAAGKVTHNREHISYTGYKRQYIGKKGTRAYGGYPDYHVSCNCSIFHFAESASQAPQRSVQRRLSWLLGDLRRMQPLRGGCGRSCQGLAGMKKGHFRCPFFIFAFYKKGEYVILRIVSLCKDWKVLCQKAVKGQTALEWAIPAGAGKA